LTCYPSGVRLARKLWKDKIFLVGEDMLRLHCSKAAGLKRLWSQPRRDPRGGLIIESPFGTLRALRPAEFPWVGWCASRADTLLVTNTPVRRIAVFDFAYLAINAAVAHASDGYEDELCLGDNLHWRNVDPLQQAA
jgi:hypothetical protein